MEKLRYLSQGAEAVVFAGSLPRGVDEAFYADAARELARRGVRVVLDTDGEPLRLGLEAEPWLVSPNQHEAEQLVGQELADDDDFLMALDAIAELGARNVHITTETGCFALDPRGAAGAPLPRRTRRSSSRSRWSGRATRCSRSSSPRTSPTPTPDEALRLAVAAGAASVLEVGAGCFDPAEARRLASLVEVHELEPVA